MTGPAWIPAVAILIGTVAGCVLWPDAPVTALVPALLVMYAMAATAYMVGRRGAFLVLVALTFLLAAMLSAIDASACALRSSLAALLESRTQGLAGGSAGDVPIMLRIEGELREDAAATGNGYSLSLAVDTVMEGGRRRRAEGGVQLTVFGSLAQKRATDWRAGRRVQAPAQLRRPTVYRNPGVADNRMALARRGTVLVGSVKSGALVEVTQRGTWVAELAAWCRSEVRRTVGDSVGRWNDRSAAIVTAILIGDRAGLDAEVRERLQQAGTYHVIAISGGNIAILAGLSVVLLRLAGIGSRATCAGTAVVLISYAGLVGGGASVSRATLMAVTYLLARLGDHRGPALNALAVSLSILLVVEPLTVFDPALALTAGATLGILVGSGRLGKRLPARPWLRAPATLGLASLAAELALVPVAALAFSRVTFAGLALNFVAIPLMTVAQVAGMAALPLLAISGPAGRVAGFVAHLGASGLVESAKLVDAAPWLAFRVPPPGWWAVGAYYGGWLAWLWSSVSRGTPARVSAMQAFIRCAGVACVALSGLWILICPALLASARGNGRLQVTFLDVGQADAVLVRWPGGRSMLVDAGGFRSASAFDIGSRVVAPALWALGVRRLDVLAISHGDPDHVGGALSVVRDFAPREVWEGVPVPPDASMRALRRGAERAGAWWRTLSVGHAMEIDGVTVRVWHPPPPDWERQRVRNDDSLVLELTFKRVSVLLPGDISREVERALAPRLAPSGLRILKVPHHGSSSSSSALFLGAVRPDLAVLTVGRGTFVAREVLAAYRAAGATLFRTDRDGAVTIETDGETVDIRTFAGTHRTLHPASNTTKSVKD